MQMKLTIFAVTSFVALVGCAKHYWAKPGGTAAEFERDNFGCARAALGYQESSALGGGFSGGAGGFRAESFKGTKINEDLYKLCIRERGWKREKMFEPDGNAWRGITDEL